MKSNIKLLYVDLFCGAGGTSTGVESAMLNGEKCAKVICCVNHDKNAIASHKANHPGALHFTEDIRTLELSEMLNYVAKQRMLYPNAKLVLWLSAECTSHSKAKGGTSRDADSRTLPEHCERYIEALQPDFVQVENVVEFLDWCRLKIKVVTDPKTGEELYCPLSIKKDKKHKTVTIQPVYIPYYKYKGEHYRQWVERIEGMGFHYDYKIMNAADYGARTSRRRYFGIFAKHGLPIEFPHPTHSKNPIGSLKKWLPVKDVLDFSVEGESIFDRDPPIVDATFTRVYSGLVRFVGNGDDKWLLKYNSKNGATGKHIPPSIHEPCPTVSCQGRLGIFQASFLSKHFSGHPGSKNISIDEPAHAITTIDHHSLVQSNFITCYYGNGYNQSTEEPCPTLTTNDRCALVETFLMNNYSGGGQLTDLERPCPAVVTNPKQNIIECRFIDQQFGNSKAAPIYSPIGAITQNPKYNIVSCWIMNPNFNNIGASIEEPSKVLTANRKHHYLMNPQFSSKGGDINNPCFTLIARMDKMPPYLITTDSSRTRKPFFVKICLNTVIYEIYEADSEIIKKIKLFMAAFGIIDIKMRMLLIPELKQIMGFSKDYILIGSQTEQKKQIGNAVERHQAKAICEATAGSLTNKNQYFNHQKQLSLF